MSISRTNYCLGTFNVWLIVTGFAYAPFQSIGMPTAITVMLGCGIGLFLAIRAWHRWSSSIFEQILPPLRIRFRRAMFFIGLANVCVTFGLLVIAADFLRSRPAANSYLLAIPFLLLIALPGYLCFFTARACLDATTDNQ